jgi:hypothetical protein
VLCSQAWPSSLAVETLQENLNQARNQSRKPSPGMLTEIIHEISFTPDSQRIEADGTVAFLAKRKVDPCNNKCAYGLHVNSSNGAATRG